MKNAVKIIGHSYKTGVDEIEGLKEAMRDAFRPIVEELNSTFYWGMRPVRWVEYKSRDGFIPYKHNCGGIELFEVLPKCEEYSFPFVEFGECDECGDAERYPDGDHLCGDKGSYCSAEGDGHLDAGFRIWFKFEGYNEDTGVLSFYLFAEGGNNDAPYFRKMPTLFEASFECKSVKGLKRAATPHVRALVRFLGGES